MTEVRLVVPQVPSTLNRWSRDFWAVRDRERKAWGTMMALACAAKKLKRSRPVFAGPVRVELHYALKSKRARNDLDNRVPKHCLDGMTGWVYVDDSQITELVQTISRGAEQDQTAIRVVPASTECCE